MQTSSSILKRLSRISGPATALCLVAGFASSAHAETSVRTCYPTSADRDGDGYAAVGTAWVNKSVSGLACPSGYVNREGDCNDGNAAIHPRVWEDAFNKPNNIDDDCDGSIDEPEPVYPSSIYSITYTTGFWVPVRVNRQVSTTFTFSTVYARVRYKDMSYDDGYHTGPKVKVTSLDSTGVYKGWVDGNSGGVYRAYVRFYDANDNFITSSDIYHVTLDPDTSPKNNVVWARYWIVNQALKETMRGEHGEVGYRGNVKVDGTAYTASRNEKWCSEFYGTMASYKLRNIGGSHNIGDLSNYFFGALWGGWPSSWSAPSDKSYFRSLQSGDYVAMDTNGDGTANHSGMVLTYDARNDRLRTVEGNSGNDVESTYRVFDKVLKGYGTIQAAMLY